MRLDQPGRVIGAQVLDDALRYQRGRVNKRDGQQHPQDSPRGVDPEITEGLCFPSCDPAHKRDGQCHARGGRPEVVRRQREHLGQIAHRGFRHVGLPVCIRCKRNSRIPGQRRRHARKVLRVQRQYRLRALDKISQQQARTAEDQHRGGVLCPAHLFVFTHASQLVQQPLYRAHHRVEPGPFTLEHPVQVKSHRLGQEQHQGEEDGNLQPAVGAHARTSPDAEPRTRGRPSVRRTEPAGKCSQPSLRPRFKNSHPSTYTTATVKSATVTIIASRSLTENPRFRSIAAHRSFARPRKDHQREVLHAGWQEEDYAARCKKAVKESEHICIGGRCSTEEAVAHPGLIEDVARLRCGLDFLP